LPVPDICRDSPRSLGAHPGSPASRRALPRYARWIAFWAVLSAVFAIFAAQPPDQRHPLEIEALNQPQAVLDKLPAARAALAKTDHIGAARLALAEANACRVMANWICQRRAGSTATEAADRTDSVYLQVRSRIALGRALSRLGDFSNASRVLTEARQRLDTQMNDELMADILLAYSSVSVRLGKLDESYRYAREGLTYADASVQPEMRSRLLRNMAKVASDTGRPREAQALLHEASVLLTSSNDPKLIAEVLLEEANAARALGDPEMVADRGRKIGDIGRKLSNSQLRGLGYETMGHSARMRGRRNEALSLYDRARREFNALRLYRDELRVVREVVDLRLKGTDVQRLPEATARLMTLTDEVARIERESAAADFDERLRYAKSEAALTTAKAATENEKLRAQASESKYRFTLVVGALALCTLGVVVALYMQQRKYAGVMRERGREMEIAIATDFLTTVRSRRYITEAGHAAVAHALDQSHPLAVAVIDLDHFKRINDRYGHAAGDEVLKAVAHAMRAVCRDTDVLGRYGGEEFAVLLQGIDREHAIGTAERLRHAVAEVAVRVGDATITPTASVGVACLTPEDSHFEQLLIRADRALYRAKEEGRNRVVAA